MKSQSPFLWDKMAKLELCEMACGNNLIDRLPLLWMGLRVHLLANVV